MDRPRLTSRVVPTASQIEEMRRLRAGGATSDAIAAAIGMSRWWCIEEMRRAGFWNGRKAIAAARAEARLALGAVAEIERGIRGPGALRAMHPIAVAVLRDAGLPIRASV